jgi:biopolymer transport protein ExbB
MIEQTKIVMVHAGATWVMWLLIGLSVACLAIALDRTRAFWAERADGAGLARALNQLLVDQGVQAARARLLGMRSAAARVALAGLDQWKNGDPAVQQAMTAAAGVERARLQRQLLFLGTVGNNAPFVGLLGTVIGIVGAFDELGRPRVAAAARAVLAPERVMSTIAEALVVTAIGLCVAIPAVAVYNHFQGRLAAALAAAETLSHVVLTHRPRAVG